jgi:hypothetical protein
MTVVLEVGCVLRFIGRATPGRTADPSNPCDVASRNALIMPEKLVGISIRKRMRPLF